MQSENDTLQDTQSVDANQTEQIARRLRQRLLMGVALIVLLFIISLGALIAVWQQRQMAIMHRMIAENERAMALEAQQTAEAVARVREKEATARATAEALAMASASSSHQDEKAMWSQNDTRILAVGSDNAIHIWDAQSGDELKKIDGRQGDILQARWSQDAARILTIDSDDAVRIWDVVSGDELIVLNGHEGTVLQAA